MSEQGFYNYSARIPANHDGWRVMVYEHEIFPAGDTSELRSYAVYSCAALHTAQEVADKVYEGHATAALAHQDSYSSGRGERLVTYALDYRPVDGPNGPARRLARRIKVTVEMVTK